MTTATLVGAGAWTADLAHTRVTFAARHLFGQTVHGTIAVTAGTVDVGPDGCPQRFHATLDPASIDTGNSRRDDDLRGRRFLDAGVYPLMEVAATRIDAAGGGWRAEAVLRARGHEAPVLVDAALDGPAAGPRLQVSGTARLDLRAVGIRVPGFLVRRLVDVSLSAQLTQPLPARPGS
jgi:polyisoprenoid-binding protein YceI